MDRLAFPDELRAMVHSGEIRPCEGEKDAVFRFCAWCPKLGRAGRRSEKGGLLPLFFEG